MNRIRVRTLLGLLGLTVLSGLSPTLAVAEPSITPAAEGAPLALKLGHDAPLERNKPMVISLALLPATGLHLLEDGPLVIELEGEALDPPRRTLRRRDAVDPRAELPRFELEVRARRTGLPALSALVTAWVCRGRRCRAVEQRVQLPLELAPEARPPARAAHGAP